MQYWKFQNISGRNYWIESKRRFPFGEVNQRPIQLRPSTPKYITITHIYIYIYIYIYICIYTANKWWFCVGSIQFCAPWKRDFHLGIRQLFSGTGGRRDLKNTMVIFQRHPTNRMRGIQSIQYPYIYIPLIYGYYMGL